MPLRVFLSLYLWLKIYYFHYSSLLEENFDQSVMWRQFVRFKEFVRPLTKVTSYSGINTLDYLSIKSNHVWCWQFYLLVNTITLLLVVYHTYEFINGFMIPHLTYCTYSQMGFSFANPTIRLKWIATFMPNNVILLVC